MQVKKEDELGHCICLAFDIFCFLGLSLLFVKFGSLLTDMCAHC